MVAEHTPVKGATVRTMDGDKIGEVGEVQGTFFKVAASMQPDYWLATQYISNMDGGEVCLSFDKDRLGDYKVDRPSYN